MSKAFFVLMGLILIGLGVWGVVAWGKAVLMLLEAVVVIAAIFTGLVIIVFTVSDLRAAKPPVETPAAPANSKEAV